MRIILGVALALSGTSCSWIFQEHLSDGYSGRGEPMCSPGGGLATLDAILAAIDIVTGIAYASSSGKDPITGESTGAIAVASIGEGVLFAASAITGGEWAGECRDARRKWSGVDPDVADEAARAQAEAKQYERNARGAVIPDETDEDKPLRKPKSKSIEVTAPPRGFFCANSPSIAEAGFCVREKDACETARAAAQTGVPDLAVCTLVETVWCFDDKRCAPSETACSAQRDRIIGPDGVGRKCVETK